MKYFLQTTLVIAGVSFAGSSLAEGIPHLAHRHAPCAHGLCRFHAEVVKEERSCWLVKPETVCIPPVRFPWQKCDKPFGPAKTRTVNTLEPQQYECDAIEYSWKIVSPEQCEMCRPAEAAPQPEPLPAPQTAPESESGSNSKSESGSESGSGSGAEARHRPPFWRPW